MISGIIVFSENYRIDRIYYNLNIEDIEWEDKENFTVTILDETWFEGEKYSETEKHTYNINDYVNE